MPVVLPDLIRNLFRKPSTLKYPYEKREPPEEFRGKPVVNRKECIGCKLCAMVCPSNVITMDSQNKPVIDLGGCIFCGECASACPRKAIVMSNEYELAVYKKSQAISK